MDIKVLKEKIAKIDEPYRSYLQEIFDFFIQATQKYDDFRTSYLDKPSNEEKETLPFFQKLFSEFLAGDSKVKFRQFCNAFSASTSESSSIELQTEVPIFFKRLFSEPLVKDSEDKFDAIWALTIGKLSSTLQREMFSFLHTLFSEFLLQETKEKFTQSSYHFWMTVRKNLPGSAWETDKSVIPWLELQHFLVKEIGLTRDIHHPIFYVYLEALFNKNRTIEQLSAAKLLNLLKNCARAIGYIEIEKKMGILSPFAEIQKQDTTYPYNQIAQKISLKQSQEFPRNASSIQMIIALFWLLKRHCTAEQRSLIKELIFYRQATTDEERCSEWVIVNSILNYDKHYQTFFEKDLSNYCQRREQPEGINDLEFLLFNNSISSTLKLIQAFNNIETFSQILRSGLYRMAYEDAKKEALILFDLFFAADFPNLVITKQVFLIETYQHYRKAEPGEVSIFSKKTKLSGAEKIRSELKGIIVKLSFWESLAIKQGRLGELTDELDSLILNP